MAGKTYTVRRRSKQEIKDLGKKAVKKTVPKAVRSKVKALWKRGISGPESGLKRMTRGAKTFKKSPRKAMSNVKQNVKRYVHKKTAPKGRSK
jgi:hypothetical protein